MQAISEDRQILVNLEINNQCHLTNVCGTSCVLNEIAWALPQAKEQSAEQVLAATQEVIDNGHKVRHLAIVGKEPLETPDLLFDILRRYHAAPVETRPARIGVITSGINLKSCQQRFVELPIDWCNS